MKKLLYLVGLVFCFASCTDDYTDWADPLTHGPENASTITLDVSDASAIDFADVTDPENTTLQLFVPHVTANDPTTASYEVTLWNEDRSQSMTLQADGDGYVNAEELRAAVEALYGKRPQARQIPLDIVGYIDVNGMTAKALGNAIAVITPAAPIIYDEYYVVGNVVANVGDGAWNIDYTGLPLTNGGVDPYENPVFTGRIPNTTDGSDVEFKVNPKGAPAGSWDLCLGAGEEEGTFVTNNKGGNLKIPADPQAVAFDLTFNMLDETWSYKPVYGIEDVYYMIGINDWDPSNTDYPVYSGSGAPGGIDPVFQVRVPATGSNIEFKLCPGSALGTWDSDFTATATSEPGKLAANNAGGNLIIEHQPDAIAYDVWFNLQSLEWGYRAIMGGDMFFEIGNESGWSKSHPLSRQDDDFVGYYYLNGEFKFKPNENNWDNDLEYDGPGEDGFTGKVADNGGSNMPGPDPGFYKIILNPYGQFYTLIPITTVGVIGDATANGWDSDQDMTWNAEYGYWYIENLTLTDGKIKFRGNDNWNGDLDLGGSPNELWIGGADIPVEAGTYDIKLFPSYSGGSHCIITKK